MSELISIKELQDLYKSSQPDDIIQKRVKKELKKVETTLISAVKLGQNQIFHDHTHLDVDSVAELIKILKAKGFYITSSACYINIIIPGCEIDNR